MHADDRAFAIELSRAAGALTLEYFGRDDLAIELKENQTPVTEADRAAEKLLRRRIAERYPDDGILGEEFGEQQSNNGRRWILDPIDGTRSFERGVPLYGNLVGLEVDGEIAVGVVHMPALGEMVHAAAGGGATWISGIGIEREVERPARVSTVDRPDAAMFSFTSYNGFDCVGERAMFERLNATFARDRGWGDCYGHLLVATGRIDVMVDPRLAPWDCAPLKVVLEEAGGTFTDLSGAATHLGGSGFSTNGLLFEATRTAVSEPG
ncbi:MAG: inositol monophosphatase family protein [Planctomycetota bacterium]|jgi:histidinol phosphatase-like enzyme (inositol monophosphatase family)